MGTSRFQGDTRNPAVNVTTFVLLVTVILSVSVRLGTKLALFKKLTIDDIVIIASLVFAIGQDIAVSLSVESGYGSHYQDVSSADLDRVMKDLFTASFLYILSLLLSKLSVAMFIRGLSPSSRDKLLARNVEFILYGWVIVVIFGTAFQCSIPRIWDIWNGRCFDLLAWRYFVSISNIVTDLLIFAQAMILVFSVQTTLARRLMFAGIFAPRLFVVVAIIAELALLKQSMHTNDPTYNMCVITILEVVIQCLSIVTACWGQLVPFLSWMRSNGLKLSLVNEPTSWTYKMSTQSQIVSKSRDRKSKFESCDAFPLQMRRDQILVTQDWDVQSQSSVAHIIGESDSRWPNDGDKRSPDQHR